MKAIVCAALAFCLLAGFCACGRSETEATSATTTESTTTEAPTTVTNLEPFERIVKQRIHESLPEFTFVLRGYARSNDNWPDMALADFRTVEVNSPNDAFHQLFDNLEVNEDILSYMHQTDLSLADYNNDGYLDLRLQLEQDRNSSSSLFWLWDTAQQCFAENKQLQKLSYGQNLFIDDNGNLRGSNTAGGGIGWGYTIYHYEKGEFIESEARNWLVESERVFVSTYRLVNGEMKLISRTEEK